MNLFCLPDADVGAQEHPLMDRTMAIGEHPRFPCPLSIPWAIRRHLVVLPIVFFSCAGNFRLGQLVIHQAIREKVVLGFSYLARARFPITSIVPIAAFGWDDERSMFADNTSAFCYRYKTGKNTGKEEDLSLHAYGLAFDINPRRNPCRSQGVWIPEGARYDPEVPGTIARDSWVACLWRDLGFTCGVDWQEPFDPQHIQMPLSVI